MNSRSYSKDYSYLMKEGCYKSNKVWCDRLGTPIGKGNRNAQGAAKAYRKLQKDIATGSIALPKISIPYSISSTIVKPGTRKIRTGEDDGLFTWEDYEK